MARPRKPASVHAINGTDRAYVKQRAETELHVEAGSVGEPPAWMSPEGQEQWHEVVANQDYSRALTSVDRGGLIQHCVLYGRFVRSECRLPAWINGAPATPDAEGEIEREKLTASEMQALLSLRMQFGLTPRSRPGVKVGPAKQKAAEPWQRLKAQ